LINVYFKIQKVYMKVEREDGMFPKGWKTYSLISAKLSPMPSLTKYWKTCTLLLTNESPSKITFMNRV
jgi:hypothetical protein